VNTEARTLRRVLVLADESADWMVAGLRQLDRLSLSLNEFAVQSKMTAPLVVCVLWSPALDQSQRWFPTHARLAMVAFTNDVGSEPFDLVLSTRLFLWRNALGQFLEVAPAPPEMVASHGEKERWESSARSFESFPQSLEGKWNYIRDGEIARAKFLESERGRRLDDLCDVASNILLVLGLGFGLSNFRGHAWFYVVEGILTALLIGANEFLLARQKPGENAALSLGGTLYPRHRELVERSGILRLGEKSAYWLIQLTKRDVAVLGFVLLAAVGLPSLILHLLFAVAAISLALALKSFSRGHAQ